MAADHEGRFERVHEPSPVISQRRWMADDGKGSAVPSLQGLSAGQVLGSSRG
jgi:S-formylglutathione hydrolase FrmB